MSTPPSRPALRLFKGTGLRIDVHASLLVVMALVTVVMATSLLPQEHAENAYSTGELWAIGAGCSLLLLLSVLVHELAHFAAERLRGRKVTSLSLVFLHSGHSPLPEAGTGPWGEVLVAAAGPLATLGLALSALVLQAFSSGHRIAQPLLEFLTVTNFLFAAVQLVPGYPLDGGRALRAVAWGLAGDANVGTRWAARVSLAFAVVLGVSCAAMLPLSGVFSMPLWGCLMAIVLGMQAVAISRMARMREKLSGLVVANVMEPLPEPLPRILSVADALASATARGASAFLVEFQGRLGGIVTLAALQGVPEEERFQTPVGQVTRKLERQHLLQPGIVLESAFRRMGEEGLPLLPVVQDDGSLVGIVRQESVARVLQGSPAR